MFAPDFEQHIQRTISRMLPLLSSARLCFHPGSRRKDASQHMKREHEQAGCCRFHRNESTSEALSNDGSTQDDVGHKRYWPLRGSECTSRIVSPHDPQKADDGGTCA
eukprot:3070671-Rhodomonas_salina.1